MKIRFLGIKNQVRKSGCSSCGRKQISTHTFQNETRMVLPGGQRKTFYAGEVYDVSEHIGQFLLEQEYMLNNTLTKMFTQV